MSWSNGMKIDLRNTELSLKCGEIYLNKNNQSEIILSCVNCNHQCLSIESFSKHLFGVHLVEELQFQIPKCSNQNLQKKNSIDCLKIEPSEEYEKQYKFFSEHETENVTVKSSNDILNSKLENNACQGENLEENKEINKLGNKEKKTLRKKGSKIPKAHFKCAICSEILKKEAKSEHLKTHEHIKRFICETCGKGCKDHYQLVQHIKNHTGERPFKCQFCLATFKSKHTLRGHEKSHLDYKPFKCNICEALFKSKRTAEQHELRHLTPVELKFECDLCGKKFSSNEKMIAHRGRHKQEKKPFECSKCPKSFQSKYACTAHERLEHKGEFNYKCNFCDKIFIKINLKKSHEATHTRVGQPFLCNLCPNKYATREGLYKHKKRNHMSNKPTPDFKCHKCNKIFKLQSEYAEHCRKHVLEEYQFICFACGANFVNEIKLKNHINIIHKFDDQK